MQNLEKGAKSGYFLVLAVLFCGNSTAAVKKKKSYFALSETTSGRVRLTGIISIEVIGDDSGVVCGWYLVQ